MIVVLVVNVPPTAPVETAVYLPRMKFTLLAGAFDELIDAYGVYAEYVLLAPPAAMLMTKSLAVAVVIDELLQAVEKQEPLEYVGLVPLSNPPSEAISNGKRTRLFVAENVAESVNDPLPVIAHEYHCCTPPDVDPPPVAEHVPTVAVPDDFAGIDEMVPVV